MWPYNFSRRTKKKKQQQNDALRDRIERGARKKNHRHHVTAIHNFLVCAMQYRNGRQEQFLCINFYSTQTFRKQFRLDTEKSLCNTFNCTQIAWNGNSISHFVRLHRIACVFNPRILCSIVKLKRLRLSSNHLTISRQKFRTVNTIRKLHVPLNAITSVAAFL